MAMKVSIVAPVYNEQDNVLPLAAELHQLQSAIPDLEVLLVDDGSRDQTWERIQEAQTRFSSVRGLHYDQNRGQSHAMLVGLQMAAGDVLVTIDGDMQNNPADIPRMLEALADCDAVCGFRAKRKDTWARRVGSRLANRVRNWATHDGIRDTGCSLKVFRKICVSDLPQVEGVHRFMPAYFKLNGRRIKELAVDHRARTMGTSKYTNMKRLPRTIFDLFGFVWYRKRYLVKLDPSQNQRS
ncbi:MAG: glycosyltransferase family 2 protein [bacterium]